MARRVYFAFHYENASDFRVNVVRNSWVTRGSGQDAGFYDASLWEKAKTYGDTGIKKMIDEGLDNTSVTAVLIGAETHARKWVRYEIVKSFERGNGLLGIHINCIPDKNVSILPRGRNPFDDLCFHIGPWHQRATVSELGMSGWVSYAKVPEVTESECSIRLRRLSPGAYRFSDVFQAYDWERDSGYEHLADWVELAARDAGR